MKFLKKHTEYDSNIEKLLCLFMECILKRYRLKLVSRDCETERFHNKETEVEIILEGLIMFGEKCVEEDYTGLGENFEKTEELIRLNMIKDLMVRALYPPFKDQYRSVAYIIVDYMKQIMNPSSQCSQSCLFFGFDEQVDAIIKSSYLDEIVSLLLSQEQKSEEQKKREEEQDKKDKEEKELSNDMRARRRWSN